MINLFLNKYDGNFDDDIMNLIPDTGIIQRLSYNVGYVKHDWKNDYNKGWRHYTELDINKTYDAITEFKETATHELGHSILKSYRGIWYSFTHDDSSYVWQTPNGEKSYTTQKRIGEINLMHYFKDDPYQSKYDFDLIVASNQDILGLIWLTKLKID